MKQIKLTQGRYALVDDADYEYLSQFNWCVNGARRYAVSKLGKHKGDVVLMHRLIMGTPKGMHTDHINGDGLDNRRSNLRKCTPSQNQANRKVQVTNKYRLKGVHWSKSKRKYVAQIVVRGTRKFLGHYLSAEAAARAYDAAAKVAFGEYAKVNYV